MPGPEITLEDLEKLTLHWTTYAIKDWADLFGRLSTVSGLYVSHRASSQLKVELAVVNSVVRLDVDGSYPLMTASGTYSGNPLISLGADLEPVHWIAYPLEPKGDKTWEGDIIVKYPFLPYLLPHSRVRLKVDGSAVSVVGPRLTVTFFGNARAMTHELRFESPWFHAAEFEYDIVEGVCQTGDYRDELRSRRWDAAPLRNPEVDRTDPRIAVAAIVILCLITLIVLVLGYGSGFWGLPA